MLIVQENEVSAIFMKVRIKIKINPTCRFFTATRPIKPESNKTEIYETEI